MSLSKCTSSRCKTENKVQDRVRFEDNCLSQKLPYVYMLAIMTRTTLLSENQIQSGRY